MIADTSAALAILFEEAGAQRFASALETAPTTAISTVSLLEATIVMLNRKGVAGVSRLDRFIATAIARIVPFDEAQCEIARNAFERFGKGRHPAGLNFGDCCAYALAMREGLPLLYKGDDFAKTDVVSALA